MPRINNLTDFEFIIELHAVNGVLTALSQFDFEGTIFCVSDNYVGRQYSFCRYGDNYRNCRFEEDGLHVLVAGHSLGYGSLMGTFTALVPDPRLPSGVWRVTVQFNTDIIIIPL